MDPLEICQKCTQRQGCRASRPETPRPEYDEVEIWQDTVEEIQSEYDFASDAPFESLPGETGNCLNN